MRPRTSFALIILLLQYHWLGIWAKNFSTIPWGRQQTHLPRQATVFDTRPAECPPCFNCNLEDFTCQQFGQCGASNGKCTCPEGFGGDDCGLPLCGSPVDGVDRAPRPSDQKYCQCAEGWEGINCNVCASDLACDALMPAGKDGVCYRGGIVQKQNYQFCDVMNQKIIDMLDPRRPQVTFSCNADDHTCNFQFWVEHQESFYCALDTCDWEFQAQPDYNSTSYNCEHIQCRCIPGRFLCNEDGNLDLSGFIADSIKGPATFKSVQYFDEKTNDTASFSEPKLDGLIAQVFGDESIFLSCGGGECLYRTQVPGYEKPVKVINTPLIAGIISGCALLVIIAGLIFAWLSRKRSSPERYGMVLVKDEDEASQALMEDHKPTALHFSDMSYRIAGKQVLSDVQGAVHSGELLAIMGASGAGKTTFLDILAHKDKRGSSSGMVYVNGEVISRQDFRLLSGFVDQEDTMLPTLTVHETILDSALLRLPKQMSLAAKQQRVDEVERQLGIHHIRDSVIGSAEGRRGISGGEKRRVSIACELVTSPSFVFLDEPTSGLDAFNAYNVIECLKSLARSHDRTVIFTIHQPRSNIVALFDQLLLLAEGRAVYSGPASECQAYFDGIGYPCPAGFNIADYLIDLTMDNSEEYHNSQQQGEHGRAARKSTDSEGLESQNVDAFDETSRDSSWLELSKQPKPAQASENIHDTNDPTMASRSLSESGSGRILDKLLEAYSISKIAEKLQQDIHKASQHPDQQDKSTTHHTRTSPKNKNKISTFQQFKILSLRTWRNLHRNPMLMLTHYATSIVLAVLLGYLFFSLTDDISGFQNRMGILSFVLALFGFSTLTTLTVFAEERLLFVRERANGYYHPLAYFLAKLCFDMFPLRFLPPVMLSAIVYPMTGLVADWSHFGTFVLVLVLFNFAAASVCLFIGIVVKNPGTANLLGSLFMLFSLLFSGLFLNHETIPAAALWLQLLSIFHYAFESLLVNEVRYLTLIEHKFGLDIEVPGASILSSFGFRATALWPDVAGLCGFILVFVLLAYLAMHFLLVERR